MNTMVRRVPRLFSAAALVVGATALSVAAPVAAMAQPAAAAAPTVSVHDGTLVSSDPSLASEPVTYRCEAGGTAAITVKLRQPFGEYGFIDGAARQTVNCTGEPATTTLTIASHQSDPWRVGHVTGEVSIFEQSRATAHQPFTITLSR
ncbi:hypothetical protein [Agromyces aerolatus]|uniref:hypothetical protein n=1 Tax=Agromyces sp. LY-1074 TaxID=3074080 RepID=UPI002859B87D|nr:MULTISPECIES: hypothetical protein [unclassified Agromyces]MDR5698807.1 hypothetical protein [Agromyces sp. LY-1074]MDR5705415.1 hypothetical protein [Agromyces sp. LY-1358]